MSTENEAPEGEETPPETPTKAAMKTLGDRLRWEWKEPSTGPGYRVGYMGQIRLFTIALAMDVMSGYILRTQLPGLKVDQWRGFPTEAAAQGKAIDIVNAWIRRAELD